MGALVGVMESQFLDGFEVTDRTRELLTANGWTEPAALSSGSNSIPSDIWQDLAEGT